MTTDFKLSWPFKLNKKTLILHSIYYDVIITDYLAAPTVTDFQHSWWALLILVMQPGLIHW